MNLPHVPRAPRSQQSGPDREPIAADAASLLFPVCMGVLLAALGPLVLDRVSVALVVW